MLNQQYVDRTRVGLTGTGSLVGEVVEYLGKPDEPEAVTLKVKEADLGDLKAGDVVRVRLDVPKDANFLLKDLARGDHAAGYEAVPVGREVKFTECAMAGLGEVDACGFEVPGMDPFAYASSAPSI